MTGLGPVVACAGYAGLLWIVALALDAIGRRSLRARHPTPREDVALTSDVALFHSVIAGAALGVGAFLTVAYAAARRDGPALLLVPVAGLCASGAARRLAPLWLDRQGGASVAGGRDRSTPSMGGAEDEHERRVDERAAGGTRRGRKPTPR